MIELNRPRNRLLASLPDADWLKLQHAFHPVELETGQVLVDQHEPISQVFFPTTCVTATVAAFTDGRRALTATIGREGMAPPAAVLGSDRAIQRNVVQVEGSAMAMAYEELLSAQQEFPAFRRVLLAYSRVFLAHVMQSVACSTLHNVEERCARFMLRWHDRSDGDGFLLTQELLSEMLGVSRAAVNKAARTLQEAGLIRYRRGLVSVVDRTGLEASSCECYRIIRSHYYDNLQEGLVECSSWKEENRLDGPPRSGERR